MHVHLVGSVGLDCAEDVFRTAGKVVGPFLLRCPDGEVGGRRLWISWQYPLLRSSPYLRPDMTRITGAGFATLRLAEGVSAADVRFGELGYAREARTSYQDFMAARQRGDLPPGVRFQVSLPTPHAVVKAFVASEDQQAVEAAYEPAMLREVARICAAIPHEDLALQWDVCIEMVTWDGGFTPWPRFPGIEQLYAAKFERLCAGIPGEVELGFHLCYGDLDAKHFVEPRDTRALADFATMLVRSVGHPIAYVHVPVPVNRSDDAYFAPLANLRLPEGTELFLGLVHATDGVEGTLRRMEAASKYVQGFGIATECGIARARTVQLVEEILRVHAGAAAAATAA